MGSNVSKSWLRACAAMLMAVVVALGIALAASPTRAYAEETPGDAQSSGAISVALTIVDEQADIVLYNGKVIGLTAQNTVEDLLAAAGFTKVDAYVGDPATYEDSYGSPSGFLGLAYDPETWAYWVTIFDGSSANYAEATLSAQLKDGGHYQYVYTNRTDETFTTTFAYTEAIPDPLTTEVSETTQLINNLTKRFAKGGANGKIDNFTYNAAIAIGYLGKGYLVDVAAINEAAATAISESDAGRVAKYALALAAIGQNDAAVELVQKIDTELPAVTGDWAIYTLMLILPAYDNTGVVPSGVNYTIDGLVTAILEQQAESGLFPAQYSGTQETAEAIYALTPHIDNKSVSAALEKARAASVKDLDPETGALPPSPWATGYAMDYDGMGELIDAIFVYDSACEKTVGPEVAKMATALANSADATLDGFKDAGTSNEDMTAATVFRGLAAARLSGWNDVSLDNVVDLREDIADASVDGLAALTYTGSTLAPKYTVSLKGKTLSAGTDYDAVLSNNTNAGTAHLTLTGKGDYIGTKTVDFAINKANISKAKVTKIKKQKYKKGKAITPAVTVKFNGKKLKKGTDYTVTYKNNKKPGKATVTIKGKGNFKGTTKTTFKIVK